MSAYHFSKVRLYHLFCFVFLISILPISCSSSSDSVDGDTVDGDTVDGDTVDGDTVDGDTVDGDAVDGDAVDGDAVDGDAVDGDTVDGDTVDGDTVDGDAVDGDAVDGDAIELDKETELEIEPEEEAEILPDCTCAVDQFNDDFEDGNLYGWKSSSKYEVVLDDTIAANGSNSSMKLTKLSTGGTGVHKSFDAVTPCEISFWTYVEQCPTSGQYQNFVTTRGDSATVFKFSITNLFGLSFSDNNGQNKKIADCSAQNWYHVQVFPDWDNQTIDIYLDDVLVKDDFPFYSSTATFINLFYFHHSANGVSGHLDEVQFFTDCNEAVDGDVENEIEEPVHWLGDDFEDGNADGWVNAGSGYTATVNNTYTALGTDYSLEVFTATGGTLEYGPVMSFEPYQPCEVSFFVWADTCPITSVQYQNYVVLKGKDIYNTIGGIFHFFITEHGLRLLLTDEFVPKSLGECVDKTWYKISVYLNWDNRTLSVFLNGVSKHVDLPFNSEAQFADTLYLYNLSTNSKGRFDEIELKDICP